ncbi:hypothetical protein DACRYDRAFT_16632 [Dacryopinax primogenitus]|uniref:Uncharacterized protein n=1 Tax=Dacryopinax primogenitus (strain DJM 731) TaxID=1858805 RepID=M5FSZ8_DACPD|nr:uncharacterized protein DACRYDRAFT_16632 [Dacryopinax primogenitus]EJU00661.1 hypothetical protein DACRYDRAFT_16632 [Dacryopinax primogenitus]
MTPKPYTILIYPSDEFKKAMGEEWIKEVSNNFNYKFTGDRTLKEEIIIAAEAMFEVQQILLAEIKRVGLQEMEDNVFAFPFEVYYVDHAYMNRRIPYTPLVKRMDPDKRILQRSTDRKICKGIPTLTQKVWETFMEYRRNQDSNSDECHDKSVSELNHTLKLGLWMTKINWEHLRME